MRQRLWQVALLAAGFVILPASLALAHGGGMDEGDIMGPLLYGFLIGASGFVFMAWEEVALAIRGVLEGSSRAEGWGKHPDT